MFYIILLILAIFLGFALAWKMDNIIYKGSNRFKKGFLVTSKVKQIVPMKMDQNGTLREVYEVSCQFDYNGLHELTIYLSKEAGASLKIGDLIECIYDSKADILITKKEYDSMRELNISVLKMVLITFSLIIIFIIFAFKSVD